MTDKLKSRDRFWSIARSNFFTVKEGCLLNIYGQNVVTKITSLFVSHFYSFFENFIV